MKIYIAYINGKKVHQSNSIGGLNSFLIKRMELNVTNCMDSVEITIEVQS